MRSETKAPSQRQFISDRNKLEKQLRQSSKLINQTESLLKMLQFLRAIANVPGWSALALLTTSKLAVVFFLTKDFTSMVIGTFIEHVVVGILLIWPLANAKFIQMANSNHSELRKLHPTRWLLLIFPGLVVSILAEGRTIDDTPLYIVLPSLCVWFISCFAFFAYFWSCAKVIVIADSRKTAFNSISLAALLLFILPLGMFFIQAQYTKEILTHPEPA